MLATPKPYFENVAGRLVEDSGGFVRAIWSSKLRNPADTAAMFENMRLGLQRRGWSRILIDQRQMRPFSSEEQVAIAQQWLPRLVREGGYRYGAVLVSSDVMVRLATAYITTHVQDIPLAYRSFDQETEALHWLRQQLGTGPQ